MNPKIIFEDDHLLVIEKPTGLVVNRAESVKGQTLQDWLEIKFKLQSAMLKVRGETEFKSRSGIVHRLDKETSGLMVVTKTPEAYHHLVGQFKDRLVIKKYLTLVHGRLRPLTGDIQAPIKRNPFNRLRFGVFVDGRPSTSQYQVLDYYQNPKEKNKSKRYFSLVEVTPKTGRTHQIRVHFSHLHYPVVSDDLYAGRKTSRHDRAWCPRLFLHAAYLEFNHPVNNQRLNYSSELPDDLKQALYKRERVE